MSQLTSRSIFIVYIIHKIKNACHANVTGNVAMQLASMLASAVRRVREHSRMEENIRVFYYTLLIIKIPSQGFTGAISRDWCQVSKLASSLRTSYPGSVLRRPPDAAFRLSIPGDVSLVASFLLSHLPGLNRGPHPYHGCALPTELRWQKNAV